MAKYKTKDNVIIETKVDLRQPDSQIVPYKDILAERLDIVATLLLSGNSTRTIYNRCINTLDWGVNTRTIDGYIAKVKQQQRAYYDSQLPTLLKDTASQYELLYKQAIKSGDVRAAAKILQMKYEMINGKPIQETRELSKQEQPSFTIVQVVDGKEQKIDLRIDKKEEIKELPPADGGVGEGL
jgi:hypothetical protein